MKAAVVLALAVLLAPIPDVVAQDAAMPEPARGELLYSTYCRACHTTHMHWRDNRVATDWVRLKDQVRRFQAIQNLAWGDEDVNAVSGYLNRLYYHYSPPEERAVNGSAQPRG